MLNNERRAGTEDYSGMQMKFIPSPPLTQKRC